MPIITFQSMPSLCILSTKSNSTKVRTANACEWLIQVKINNDIQSAAVWSTQLASYERKSSLQLARKTSLFVLEGSSTSLQRETKATLACRMMSR